MSAAWSGPGARVPADRPDAVVFDCDGTLADTESVSERAWEEVLARRGYRATVEDHDAIIGLPFARSWEHYLGRVDLGEPREFRAELRSRFVELLAEGLHLYEDALTTMRRLAQAEVPIGVASSSTRRHVERILELGGVRDLVATVVSADDVTEHKPAPEPYLAAVGALGVRPERAVAIEDTAVGIASARAAGLFTVGVRRRGIPAARLSAAHLVVESIEVGLLLPDGT